RPLEITANVLQQAEAAWTEKSYARALSLYREALKTASVPDSDEVEFRIAQALGETKQWDAAIEAGDELIAKTNNKARVLYWVARLYQKVQHYGWRVGNKIYHNDVYPKVNDASKPEAGWFLREDAQRSLDYLERAKLAAASERTWKTPSDKPAGHPLTAVEEIQLDLDLAALLPAVTLVDFAKWLELNDSVPLGETIDTTQSYDRGWHLPKKVLYLYEEVRRLDLTPKHHSTVVALLAESEFLETYERAMQAWQQRMAREKQRLPHYPYESLHAMDLWQAIQQEFPDDPLAPTAQLMIAYHWNGYDASGRPRQALAAFRTLIARYPQSLWVSDARAGIKNITQPLMQITLPTTGAPGQNIKMRYQARNVRRIECHAYRINKLEDVILHAKALADRESRFGDFNAFFGSLDNLPQRFGVSVASWTIAPRGVEEYRLDSGTMTTPLKQPGAYIVVAQGGQQKWAQVVLISDLALLKLADSKQGLVLAVNARTGRPLPGVNVLIKEFYEEPEKGASASVLRGVTNANGQFAKKKSCPRGYFSQIAFAWFNGRYAWTGAGHGHGYEAAYSRQEPYRFYIYTDRPVYRPGQRLYFRQIVTQQQGNRLVPLKKAKVRVTISEPYRTQLYQVILTTSEFGTINGSFTLPQVLRLGEYEIKAELITTTDTRGYPQTPGSSTKFRIEEYKRPEYIVTVETPTTAVRAGSKVKATIQVRYYFGAPVPHAEVEYVVRRRESQVTLNQDSSYNWFHPEQLNPEWSVRLESQKREQLVQSGRVTTDSQGNAAIEIPTELMTPSKPPVQISQVSVDEGSVSQMDHEYGHMDHEYSRSEPDPSPHQSVLYTVQAEVTDASRRTVTGAGHIQVTAQSYFAFLKSPLGYYHAGETVPVRITTRDANDHPVSAAAKVTVYQLLPRQAQREVYTARAQTDAGGHSTWNWPHAQTGQFRIVYEAGQSASDKITATLDVWVQGATFDHTPLRLQGAQLLPEQPFYAPEGKARVLLVVSKPDTRVLLAQVVGDTIVESDMVTVLGKSREIVIPLRPGYGPNFALVAALVKDYQVYRTRTDILIPPRQSLLHIKVASDKSVYKPGQRGVFQIEATDWRGQPARAELSLALFDKSLLAVQQDETQDIQVFHYGAPRQTYYSFDSHQSVMVQTVSQPDRYDGYEAHDWESMEHLGQMQLRPGAGWTDYMSVPGNAYMSVVGNTIMMSY
ncbi:MAG: hypothetical protein JOZ57_06095, partial [Abitibacteriaceae bacterium]|nr:hypothetical protein [Abditibacteriaceae bacterium]